MFELWKVMGRAMLDKNFLQELRNSIGNQNLDPRADNDALRKTLARSGAFMTRFERGELQYWLRDEVFLDTLEKLEEEWVKNHSGKNFIGDFEGSGGLYAAVALALFDKVFRRLVENEADLREYGFKRDDSPGGQRQVNNPRRDEKQIDAVQKEQIARFLKDPRVDKLYNILERLGWGSVCREAVSYDSTYEHVHESSSSSSMFMIRPRY